MRKDERMSEYVRRVEEYLDVGHGEAWLRDDRLAQLVEKALLFFDGQRYTMHAWVIMPNHVHTLFTPIIGWSLSRIMQSWKRFTSREVNLLLGRQGSFWYKDYFDRYIRNDQHYASTENYIDMNPVKAGLSGNPEDWPWSSARFREHTM